MTESVFSGDIVIKAYDSGNDKPLMCFFKDILLQVVSNI